MMGLGQPYVRAMNQLESKPTLHHLDVILVSPSRLYFRGESLDKRDRSIELDGNVTLNFQNQWSLTRKGEKLMNSGKVAVPLLILRIGLGIFLILWSIDKLVAPESTARIFQSFYSLEISTSVAYVVGVLELFLSLAILAGLWKTATYGAGLVLHGISTLSSYSQLLSPFGSNHLFIAALPVLAGFIALFLLRQHDTKWTLGSG